MIHMSSASPSQKATFGQVPSVRAGYEVPEFSAEEIDRLLELLEDKASAINDAAVATPSGNNSPSTLTVGMKKALNNAMPVLGDIRDFIRALLEEEGHDKGRPILTDLFGGDCERIAQLQVSIDLVKALLEGSNLAREPRLVQCSEATGIIADVLCGSGLRSKMEEAQQRGRQRLNTEAVVKTATTRRASIGFCIPDCEDTEEVPPAKGRGYDDEPAQAAKKEEPVRLSADQRMILLQEIDDEDDGQTVDSKIETLFKAYDFDDSGFLCGEEYTKAMQELTEYVLAEAQKRATALKMPVMMPPANLVQDWIIGVVDPNGDGAITLEEAKQGFKKVVDEVDDKSEYRKRKQAAAVK